MLPDIILRPDAGSPQEPAVFLTIKSCAAYPVGHMGPRESFLRELEDLTRAHLRALAQESTDVFGRFIMAPGLATAIYPTLVDEFQMDGAQEIGATLVDLFAGELDNGTVMVSEREYRGLKFTLEQFGDSLPDGPRESLENLVWTLSRANK